ncbi:MAG: cation diffusion facilitator family transporter [Candidatus Thiodiazotropha sp. (ex Lucinoma aequizonata)]|nr:cation diffusion facilitator family transporter [Candidatus Thiodiazotropha sp. (ex Lucinoma aequizonata)]MCU7889584.1 cation diffusion facilitator family transporter [Candidatus Thiodiazotropha sp. (ex Lucinoma aequizonata)]MCU7895888.1 cation diffusion facilitator family transporter [Candidatus Thiodiazotropha sp. (ex Lucinoma aequizonata)]MCU7897525.1 cation diffusion facilitator family transporter [Candidatus Thiodiazotropha sp. (ex Lucinoma aequizonata)]MCU7900886.1 cation diffusion fac
MIQEQRYEVSRKVGVVGALTNTLLAVLKIVFGWIGQSQSLIADGVHSFSDLLTDALVLFMARHAKEAPDEDHPYGHGRFETVGTLVLGGILITVGIGIVWDAAERLFVPEKLLQPEPFTLYVAAFSIFANEGLFFYTRYFANLINSNLLRANAWHHRSDSVSSMVVLIGIGGTMLGLPYLDAIAAVLVGLMVAKIGWDLGWTASQELADAGLEEDSVLEIRDFIGKISGVKSVHMLRTRKLGGHALADVHVQVDPWLSVSEGHRIAEVVQYGLIDGVDVLEDVTVHIDPEDDEEGPSCAQLPLRSEAEALLDSLWAEITCYEERKRVVLHYLSGRIDVDLHLPTHYFTSNEKADSLCDKFQMAIDGSNVFRKVQIWFG